MKLSACLFIWFASTAGETLDSSVSSGHLGHRIRRQKLMEASFPSFGFDTFPELEPIIRLDTGGQSKVVEQLGHDNRRGSQPRYLSSSSSITDKSMLDVS
ncbi:Os01g0868400 [Oryza sativa Japonica Group]|uniref:Os01g0868400 protein n=1 Tax=Oryza sativa subsp. japonica TaxID=39947 RepID=A0A0N7KE47_ORYSJ|nr:hypothetical protein EE612_007033 [Oryza sativa]BAS75409.1 Os01g0868400 [Oryza sativa Japonica Group]